MAWPGGHRGGHNELVSSPAPDFEFGTDGPSLIMAGVDGSRTSLRAAAYAGGLARRQRSRLLAVYVGRVPARAAAAGGASAARQTLRRVAPASGRVGPPRTARARAVIKSATGR